MNGRASFARCEIAKDGHQFQFRQYIETGMADVARRLKKAKFLTGLSRADFAAKAGEIVVDVNYVHPFREGNGRTQLYFLEQLAKQAGHPIDLRQLDPQRWISDTKRQRLEDIVELILDSAAIIVTARKAKRVEDERKAREWAEEEKRRRDLKRRLILQDKRIEALNLPMEKFVKARAVDDFVDDYLRRYPDLPANCRMLMEWVRAYADFLRDKAVPAALEALLEKHRLMDDATEISEWVRIN